MPDGLNNLSRSAIGRPLAVFRHRPFLIFWIGACISNTGNWTENAAQSWAVTSQTIGNPHQGLLVETLQFADFCPVLLLALLAGVISDRVNQKVWLITLQALACALGAGLAVAAFLGRATPWVVIAFTFLEGIVWALNGPVFLSVVPSLVPRAELSPALALNSVQFNMARLCGPMLAAALIGAFGVAGAFTFNACTFLPLLVALLFAIPNAPAPSRPKTVSIYDDIREGLKFVWTSPGTRRLTIMGMIFMFLAAPLQGLLPVFAQSVLKGGPGLFGLMLSAIGLGSILGAFLLSCIPVLLPPPPPHPSGHVRLCRHRTAFQPLHHTCLEPDHPGRQRLLLVAEPESEQHRQSTPRHRCEPRAGPVGYASGATRRDAAWPPVRGLSNPLYVPTLGAAPYARHAPGGDGGLSFRA